MSKRKKIVFIMVKGKTHQYSVKKFFNDPDSLTLCYLSSIVKSNFDDIDIEIYDETIEEIKKENIKADLIGISALTPCINRAYKYAEYFKSIGIPVFIGGIHSTLIPDEVAQHADSVIVGLANESLPQLINDFYNGELKQIYKQSEKMSFLNWAIPDRKIYSTKPKGNVEISKVYATFGCSNVCEFCVQPYICSGYHQRPVDEVINEIKLIEDDYIEFIDPNLAKDENYLIELCQKLIPLNKKWFAPMTITIAKNNELLDLLAKSGCKNILIGFESINKDSIKDLKKGFNKVEDYIDTIKKFHSRGIEITGSFVFGLDSDTKNIFKQTVKFVKAAKIDYPRFTINTPYPGTEFYKRMENEHRIIETDWTLYDCLHSVIKPKNMSAEELEKGFKWAWEKTYAPFSTIQRLFYKSTLKSFLKRLFINLLIGSTFKKMLKCDKEYLTTNDDI